MANRYWVGGTGTWNTSSTTNWSASSGGPNGASVPTAADSVFFDQAGTYTVTTTGSLTCLDFTVSAGTVAFTNTGTITVSGSMSLLAGTTWGGSMGLAFNATTTGKTVTTNGVVLGNTSFSGAGGYWTLGSALTVGSTSSITVLAGTFDTGGYAVSCGIFNSSNSNVRTIKLNSSTINVGVAISGGIWNCAIVTNLTFNAGTSTIIVNNNSSTFGTSNATTGLTFYNVTFASGSTSSTILGANTFNNLTVIKSGSVGVSTLNFSNSQTINGTLSTTSTAGNRRVFFASSTYGIGWTLTCNSASSLTDADFRDIYVKGTAAPISGTRIGNRGNCSGITFSTPKTVYWYLNSAGLVNWSDNYWAATSGGAVSTNNFPLPQDTAIINNTSAPDSAGLQLESAIGYIPTVDFSTRTLSLTFYISNNNTIYGNLTNGSGVTYSNSSTLIFAGGSTQTITSAGKTLTCSISLNTYGGTVQLADALNISTNVLDITTGTFNTQGFAVTASNLTTTNTNVRTLSLGASTVTFTVNGTAISAGSATNLTLNAGTSQINCSGQSTDIQLGSNTGEPFTLYNFATTVASNASIAFSGKLTLNNLNIQSRNIGILPVTFSNNATINGTLNCIGTSATARVFIR
jgi:hypothetical protein